MITIVPYKAEWKAEFLSFGSLLRQGLGDLALRIDHIGSTAVPGLAAKDIIDIQVTTPALTPEIEQALNRCGYQRVPRISGDHLPPGILEQGDEWRKWFFKPIIASRPVNLHVRMPGRANQRYPLLFRDYLRAYSTIAQAYAQAKVALVKYHPEDDLDVYYEVKDPVCDIIIGGAELWAASTDWVMGPSDC
jgi:GrpB-like predicted nucleotidyltransferase (UPF0157 family)